ncbi:MAG: hypothetical protein GXY37_10065 [Chloroflexi bacterium]|nr:hypothetical protein [Chloroflexota bacterium]
MRKFSLTRFLFCCAAAIALISPAQPVSAGQPTTVFEVNTYADLVDEYPNGICSAGSITGGPCSLRAAIYDAATWNANGYNVRILLPPGTYQLTQQGSGTDNPFFGDLDLVLIHKTMNLSVTIEGTGTQPSVIDARWIDRVLDIWPETPEAGNRHHVILSNLVIKNGLIRSTTDLSARGGGVRVDRVDLTVENVRFMDNEARGVSQGEGYKDGAGGGLSIGYAKLIMSDCELDGNEADYGSALSIWDPESAKYTFVQRTSFHDNHSGSTVIHAYGTLYLVNSTLAYNSSTRESSVGVRSFGPAFIHSSTLQISGAGTNLECIFETCMLRNSALIREPKNGKIGRNCRAGDAISSEGGNVMDDDTCPGPGKVIYPGTWRMVFAGQYFLPSSDSPVVNYIPPNDCKAFQFGQSVDPVDAPLQTDQRKFSRGGWCDAGSIETPNVNFLPVIFK